MSSGELAPVFVIHPQTVDRIADIQEMLARLIILLGAPFATARLIGDACAHECPNQTESAGARPRIMSLMAELMAYLL
jgi:hypothetical protein